MHKEGQPLKRKTTGVEKNVGRRREDYDQRKYVPACLAVCLQVPCTRHSPTNEVKSPRESAGFALAMTRCAIAKKCQENC